MLKAASPSNVWAVRSLASEGKYHMHRQLAEGRRVFVSAKLASVALNYWRGSGTKPDTNRMAIIKGQNQLRHHRYTETLRNNRLGPVEAFSDSPGLAGTSVLPRFTTKELFVLMLLATRILILGRRRDLSVYYLYFFCAVERVAGSHLSELESFVCYNDQPFDVAAFIYALNKNNRCKTIVIQHGLILSPNFYFPCHASEFWAWGPLSLEHFRTRHAEGTCIITGRYAEDAERLAADYILCPETGSIRILIAFSFFHSEIKSGIDKVAAIRRDIPQPLRNRIKFSIKLHPATKMRFWLRSTLKFSADWLELVDGEMELLVNDFDGLITYNSSSVVDFILAGRWIFFISHAGQQSSPARLAGWTLYSSSDMLEILTSTVQSNNDVRNKFLSDSINV